MVNEAEVLKKFEQEFPAGHILFREGESGKEMFVILSGKITISKKVRDQEQILVTLPPGEFFGEMSILNNKPRSATATVAENCRLLVIDPKTFEEMVKKNTEIAIRMIKKLAERLRAADAQIENLMLKDSGSRVVHFLASTAESQGQPVDGGIKVSIRVEDIAQRVGLDLPHINDIINKLVKGHIVQLVSDGLIVSDINQSAEIFRISRHEGKIRGNRWMKIRIIGCDGGMAPGKLTTCFQITETLLIDAGSAASGMDFNSQRKIRDILISHIHIDHIKDLAFLADNMFGEIETIRIHALPETNRGLKKFYFNGHLWPDFTRIPSVQRPFYQLIDIEPEKEYLIDQVKVKPVKVDHTVPAVGFILQDASSSVVVSGDTGPTKRLWELSQELDNIKGFIVEVAFPNSQKAIAHEAKHFTPATLREELAKFEREQIPIGLYHLKPKFVEEIQKEIKAIGKTTLKFLHNGEVLQF